MRVYVFGIMALLTAFAGSLAEAPAKRDAAVAADEALGAHLAAADALPGVDRIEGAVFYHPDHLYEYINGAAEGFLAYDCQRLATATYQYGDARAQRIVVDLYQMPTRAEGFGIYSSERSPELKFMKLGAEGDVAGNMCVFWKDRHYAKLAARSGTPEAQRVLVRLARGLAKRLPGRAQAPELLKAFPAAGLVRRSEKYLAHNLLGHAFMPSGFTADYRFRDGKTHAFFVVADDEATAYNSYEGLRDFFAEYGQVSGHLAIGDNAFTGNEPFYGRSMIVQQDRALLGVLGDPGDEAGVPLLLGLLKNTAQHVKRSR